MGINEVKPLRVGCAFNTQGENEQRVTNPSGTMTVPIANQQPDTDKGLKVQSSANNEVDNENNNEAIEAAEREAKAMAANTEAKEEVKAEANNATEAATANEAANAEVKDETKAVTNNAAETTAAANAEAKEEVKAEANNATEAAAANEEAKETAKEEIKEEASEKKHVDRTLDIKENREARTKEVQEKLAAKGTKFDLGNNIIYTDKKEYKKAKEDAEKAQKDWETTRKAELTAERTDLKEKEINRIISQEKKAKFPKLQYKTTEDLAKDIVKNERAEQRFNSTNTFMDEQEYKKAQAARKDAVNETAKQLVAEGMSEKEAKQKAETMHDKNIYIKKDSVRQFVIDNKDTFYDENGKFSNEKYHNFFKNVANINTDKDEATNYHTSIKEADTAAATYNTKRGVMLKGSEYSGLNKEIDHSALIKTAVIVGSIAAGFGAGSLIKHTVNGAVSSVSNSATGAESVVNGAGASSSAVAEGSASATGEIIRKFGGTGATVGGALGTITAALAGKDNGGTETRVIKLDDEVAKEEKPENKEPENKKPEEECSECELTPNQETIDILVPEETCTYTLKRGKNGKPETLYDVVRDGYGLQDDKIIKKYVHVIKDRYNIPYDKYTNRTEWEMPEIDGRKFNCDVDVNATGELNKGKAKKGYKDNGYNAKTVNTQHTLYYYTDCNGNRSQAFDTAAERDKAMQEAQKKKH